jgi:hypothetical protein
MKYFKEIDFPNFDQCDVELKQYFDYLYPDKSLARNFFNFPPKDLFLKTCPNVLQGFKKLNLEFKAVFMISVVEDTNRNIHIDGSPHPCRLQWPILNSQSVDTAWYEAREEDKIVEILPNGVPYISYRVQDCKEVARKNISKPTIIRVEEPHAVIRTSCSPIDFPRIAFSFAFTETLDDFL